MVFDISFLNEILMTMAGMTGIIILLGIVVISGVYLWLINTKYRKVKILLFDRGMLINTERRLVGDMLVKARLIDLAFNPEKLVGEDIKKFQFMRKGNEKIYLAQLGAGNVLLPLKVDIDEGRIYSEGIIVGRKVAMEYINLIDEVNKTIDKTNPLITGILSVLPLAVVVLILVATTTTILDSLSKQIYPMLVSMEKISTNIDSMASKIEVIQVEANYTTSNVYG